MGKARLHNSKGDYGILIIGGICLHASVFNYILALYLFPETQPRLYELFLRSLNLGQRRNVESMDSTSATIGSVEDKPRKWMSVEL